MSWLASKPNLEISVFFRACTGTADCGWNFHAKMEGTGNRLRVTPVDPREDHCALPIRLAGLLTPPRNPSAHPARSGSPETENGRPRATAALLQGSCGCGGCQRNRCTPAYSLRMYKPWR